MLRVLFFVMALAVAQEESAESEASPDEVTFSSMAMDDRYLLGSDLTFDEAGNVQDGGARMDPDITFWHVVEFNEERIYEPTDGSSKLLAAIANQEEYSVKFAPPGLDKFKCTEKVQMLNMYMQEEFSHELPEDLIQGALATLQAEGITNTKQLGELEEKDYDDIRLPALIKSRLRKVRKESREQAEVAGAPVAMDSAEVEAYLREFQEARHTAKDGHGAKDDKAAKAETAKTEAPAKAEGETPEEEEEDGTFKALVWAVMNCPTCKASETIACFKGCRYSVEGQVKPWSDCLDECITNRFLRTTISMMLPREETKA
jgi:hypothetical protein